MIEIRLCVDKQYPLLYNLHSQQQLNDLHRSSKLWCCLERKEADKSTGTQLAGRNALASI